MTGIWACSRPGTRPVQKPHARINHSDASRRMSDAFLVRWNYAGKTSLSNCIGVSVSSCKSCKTTGVRPNVPIIRYYTVHLQEIRPRGMGNGFHQREFACDAVTRWQVSIFVSLVFQSWHEQALHASVYQRRITTKSNASSVPLGVDVCEGNDCDLLIRIRYRKPG